MGKYYSIDPETCSLEELEQTIEALKIKAEFFETQQLVTKRFINSVYGVFGTATFNLGNTAIAESITLQGQDLIKFSVIELNGYFLNKWNSDVEAHKKVSEIMLRKHPDFDATSFEYLAQHNKLIFDDLQRYGDTDSAYITIQPVIDACNIPIEQQTDFSLAVYEACVEDYMDRKFEEYAKSFNCDRNLEKFELEKISRTIIMLAKKNYMCDVAWVDAPAYFEPLQHITYTGFDVVKGSTPEFCRECMKDFVAFCFEKLNDGVLPSYDSLLSRIKTYKTKFAMQPFDEISKAVNLSEYETIIVDDSVYPPVLGKVADVSNKRFGKDVICPIHVRAAARYNNMLKTSARKYKSKYSFIRKGDKINFYYTSPDEVFGYPIGSFPAEFAPAMDVNVQFEKMILSPLNRILVAMGYQEAAPSLTYSTALW